MKGVPKEFYQKSKLELKRLIKRAAYAENYYARNGQSPNIHGDTDKRNIYIKILKEETELLKNIEKGARGEYCDKGFLAHYDRRRVSQQYSTQERRCGDVRPSVPKERSVRHDSVDGFEHPRQRDNGPRVGVFSRFKVVLVDHGKLHGDRNKCEREPKHDVRVVQLDHFMKPRDCFIYPILFKGVCIV